MKCPHCECQHDGIPALEHDRRVTELLAHNNELLEKYRAEKARAGELQLKADGLLLVTLAMASMSAIVAKELEKVTSFTRQSGGGRDERRRDETRSDRRRRRVVHGSPRRARAAYAAAVETVIDAG